MTNEINGRVTQTRPSHAAPGDAGTTGLQRVAPAVVVGEIVSADEFNTQIAQWRKDGFNVLTPAIALGTIPRDHKIVVSRVSIDPNPNNGEVYQNTLFTKQGEVAISKVGLEKMAQSAGISIDRIERVDSGTVPYLWSYRAYGWWLGFDGSRIDRTKVRTLDLRDGSDALKGFTANQIAQARIHGESVCESKAVNRLYRTYGIKQKYYQAELERPFIVCKLRWDPDMTNPMVAAIVTQVRMGATSLIFPQSMQIDLSTVNPLQLPESARPRTPPPPEDLKDETDRDEDDTIDARERPFEDTPPPAEARKPTDPGLKVTQISQKGADFYITVENGQKLHTLDRAVASACNKARIDGVAVVFDVETRAGVLEIVEISSPGSSE